MLTILYIVPMVVSVLALIFSAVALSRAKRTSSAVNRLSEDMVRSVMEEGGDASVEAVLQTVQRLLDMDDGLLRTDEALKQAREMHRR